MPAHHFIFAFQVLVKPFCWGHIRANLNPCICVANLLCSCSAMKSIAKQKAWTLVYINFSVIFWSICWQTKITIVQKKWIFSSCQAGIWTLTFRIQYPHRSTLALAHSKRNMVSKAGRQELVVRYPSKLGMQDTHHLEYLLLNFCVSFLFFFFLRKNWKLHLRATEIILELLSLFPYLFFSEPLIKTYNFDELMTLFFK